MDELEPVISFRQVSKTFFIRENRSATIRDSILNLKNPFGKKREIRALEDINFTVAKGEKLGVIGHNGSGKSTLIKLIIGALKADNGGQVHTRGRIMRLELGLGFDKEMSARENIVLNGSILGIPKEKIVSLIPEIIAFSELENYIDVSVKYFSKGMRMRLSFAIAMHLDTDILLLDEFFGGGGDQKFKKKSDKAFQEQVIKDKTLVIVSHGLTTIRKYCDRAIWLNHGRVKMIGDPETVCNEYQEYFDNFPHSKNR